MSTSVDSTAILRGGDTEHVQDPRQILLGKIVDDDPPALLARRHRDLRPERLTQPVLECCQLRICPRAAPPPGRTRDAGEGFQLANAEMLFGRSLIQLQLPHAPLDAQQRLRVSEAD